MLRSAILTLLAAVALFAVSPGSSLAQPILPHRFSGTATLDGTSIVNGSVIEAIVDGATVASATISGGSYLLDVVQPENGSFAGKAITFVVLGVVADQTATWTPFEVTVLNLTASTPLPEDDDDDDDDDGGGSVGGGGEPTTPSALPIPAPIVSTELGLAIDPLGDNLVRVWYFDNTIKTWSFF